MGYRLHFQTTTPGVVFGMIAGGIAVLCLVISLIAVVETVVLTLVGWGDFRISLRISTLMNIASGIVGGILLVLFPQPSVQSIVIAMAISILIEGLIMTRFQQNTVLLTILAVFLANMISYGIIIFPAYFYSQQ